MQAGGETCCRSFIDSFQTIMFFSLRPFKTVRVSVSISKACVILLEKPSPKVSFTFTLGFN